MGNHDELVLQNCNKLLRVGGIQELGAAKFRNHAGQDECQGVHCILGAWGFGTRKGGDPTGFTQVNKMLEINRGRHSEAVMGVGAIY